MARLNLQENLVSPPTPAPGFASIYFKTDNVLYIKDSSGTETAIGTASGITQLTGDVTATGPGVVPATVVSVGGQSASNIANAVIAFLAATNLATPNTLVERDAGGNARFATPINAADAATKAYVDTGVLTIPVAHGIANIGGVIQAIFGSVADTITQGNDSRLSATNVINVKQNPGAGEFNTLDAAMASISGNTGGNRFAIRVHPGVYTINNSTGPLTLKPFVAILVVGDNTVTFQPQDPSQDMFLVNGSSSRIAGAILSGVTGASAAAVRVTSATSPFILDLVAFNGCSNSIIMQATSSQVNVTLFNLRFISGSTTKTFVTMTSTSGQPCVMRAYNAFCTDDVGTSFVDGFYLSGAGTRIDSNLILLRSTTGVGNGVHIRDGAEFVSQGGSEFEAFDKNLWIENFGVAPIARTSTIMLRNGVTADLQIDHPGSKGSIEAKANTDTKVFVNTSAPIKLVLTDPSNSNSTGIFVKGDILQADRFDRRANLSLIAREATTLGLIEDGGALTLISGLQVNVAAGEGFLDDPIDNYLKQVVWTSTALTLPANSNLFIYVDTNSAIQFNTTPPNIENTVVLGRIVTNATTVDFIEHSQVNMNHIGNKTQVLLREGLGPIFGIGAIVTEDATPLKLDVTAGAYYYGTNTFLIAGGSAITWETIRKDGSGGWITGSQSTVDNAFYDNGSGSLVPISAGFFAKHTLYVIGDDGAEKYFLVYSQAQYSAMIDAQNAPLPLVPGYIEDAVARIAGIVVKQGQSTINTIIDLRPRLGFAAPSTTVASSHHNLTGLTDGDDHPQYLNRSGVRPMTGPLTSIDATQSTDPSTGSVILAGGLGMAKNLNVGGDTNITGVLSASNFSGSSSGTNTNDVTITDTDSIDLVLSAQNISANLKLSSDAADAGNLKATVSIHSGAGAGLHIEYPFGTPVQIGTSNNIGASSAFALSDHVHAHGNQTSPTLHALSTGSANGFMSSTDKTKLDASTALNTPSTLVFRDPSGNFAAGVISANLTGNVTGNVSGSSGSFTGTLSGDVTGTQSTTLIAVGAVTDTKASLANKPSVTVVATTNQTLSGFPTIDGQVTSATSIILLTAQTTGSQNGPWQAAAGAWTRPTWYPSGGTTQAFQFITTLVRLGSTYRGTTWRMTTAGVSTIDTTATTWVVTPIALNPSTIDGAKITATYLNRVFALTDAANIATDVSLGNTFTVTLGGNRNLSAPTNPIDGQKITYRVKQDATGGRGLTFDAVFNFGLDIIAFVTSSGANKTDYIGCIYNGATSKWDVVAVSKGF